MFTTRKQKLLNLQKAIDEKISDKQATVESHQNLDKTEAKVLVEMDLNYLNMFVSKRNIQKRQLSIVKTKQKDIPLKLLNPTSNHPQDRGC